MDPVAVGLISLGVKTGLEALDSIFGRGGRDTDANFMRADANMKLSALEETMRRAQGMQTQVLSSTQARMAATGFSTESGSFEGYLTGMAEEFTRQNEFAQKQALQSIEQQRAAADLKAGGSPADTINALVRTLKATSATGDVRKGSGQPDSGLGY